MKYTLNEATKAFHREILSKFEDELTFGLEAVKQIADAALKIGFAYGQKSASETEANKPDQ